MANTYTLENSYGSRVVVRGAGFLLNNEMTDFNTRPGVTTRRGAVGTPPNQIAPGKRMLSSQTPTIVAKNGKAVLITGSPGSRTIPNTVLCVVLQRDRFRHGRASRRRRPAAAQRMVPRRVPDGAAPGNPRESSTGSRRWATTSSANGARATLIRSRSTRRLAFIAGPRTIASWAKRRDTRIAACG